MVSLGIAKILLNLFHVSLRYFEKTTDPYAQPTPGNLRVKILLFCSQNFVENVLCVAEIFGKILEEGHFDPPGNVRVKYFFLKKSTFTFILIKPI